MKDDGKIYSTFRKEYAEDLVELEKERMKIHHSKKSRYKIERRLKANSVAALRYICGGLFQTWKVFEAQYFESDHFRLKRLNDINSGAVQEEEEKEKLTDAE